MLYQDKNGEEIKAGMFIQHDDGDIEEVHSCGDADLGINASNETYLKNHSNAERQFYPLYQFNLKEWTIKHHE